MNPSNWNTFESQGERGRLFILRPGQQVHTRALHATQGHLFSPSKAEETIFIVPLIPTDEGWKSEGKERSRITFELHFPGSGPRN